MVLTSEAGRGRPPGKHCRLGFRWNTSHRSGTCQQEAHILVNYTVRHQHSQSQRGSEEAATNQARAGQGRAGQGRQGGSSPGGSGQSWSGIFVWAGVFWDCALIFGVDDWSHRKQANADITSVKKNNNKKNREGGGWRWGRSKWIWQKKKKIKT